jgi:hypothetical protein
MKGKACLLLGLLFGSLSINLYTVSSASAASVYDNVIKPTTTLEVTNHSLTTNYLTKLDQLCKPSYTAAYNEFIQAKSTGRFAIVQDTNFTPTVKFFWNVSDLAEITWFDGGTYQQARVVDAGKFFSLYDVSGTLTCSLTTDLSNKSLGSGSLNYKLFQSTYIFNYPVGYAGADIPSSPPVGYIPHFEYFINGTEITAKYVGNLDGKFGTSQLNYVWQIGKVVGGQPTLLSESYKTAGLPPRQQSASQEYKFDVKEFGDYSIILSEPELSPAVAGVQIQTNIVQLTIDGNDQYGDTRNMDCSEGFCVPASIYEDCDTADLGCHFRNFGTFLRVLLISAFVPNSYVLRQKFDLLTTSLNETLGFLGYPIIFIASVFSSMTNNTSGFGGVINFGNFFGSNVSINVGAFSSYGAFYDIVLNIIRGFTIMYLIWILRSKYLEVVRT